MLKGLAVLVRLPLVGVVGAIPVPVQVVLEVAPGDAGHHLRAVAVVAPTARPPREGAVHAVADCHFGVGSNTSQSAEGQNELATQTTSANSSRLNYDTL